MLSYLLFEKISTSPKKFENKPFEVQNPGFYFPMTMIVMTFE